MDPATNKDLSPAMMRYVARARALLRWAPTISPAIMHELHTIQSKAATLPLARSGNKIPRNNESVPLPTYDHPDFNSVLQRKQEFREHASPQRSVVSSLEEGWKASCDAEGDFALTDLQLIMRNFIAPGTPYNGCLLHHGVGLGKSCTAVTVAESFPERKVLVLTNPGLQEAFARQVFDPSKIRERADGTLDLSAITQCTGKAYIERIAGAHLLTRQELGRRIRALISKRYTFMGLDRFSNIVSALGDDALSIERTRKQFSNTVIIVDEAHHLRNNVTGNGTGPNGKAHTKRVTSILSRVLQRTENVKLLLLTATPMFNDSRDIVDLMNLLLVNDKRAPMRTSDLFDKLGNITPAGATKLVASARGYVSYMPGGSPYSFPRRLSDMVATSATRLPVIDLYGKLILAPDRITNLRLTCTPMSLTQRAAYNVTAQDFQDSAGGDAEADADAGLDADMDADGYEDRGGHGDALAHKRGKALRTGQQIMNIVFPTSAVKAGTQTWGTGRRGFTTCFKTEVGKGGMMRVAYREGVLPFLVGPKLEETAPKIAAVLKGILGTTGVTLCYSRFVWSGAVPLALALEHVGFNRYGAPNLFKEGHGHGHGQANMKSGSKGSYIIVTGSAEVGGDADTQISAARAASNVDGNDIRVIIVTTKASEGVDLRFVRAIHILEPWYNLQRLAQIVGRASRHCSHALLPAPKRNFTLFLHAIRNTYTTGTTKVTAKAKAKATADERETLDLRAYRISESKQSRINAVQRLLIGGAFDCALNSSRILEQRRAHDPKLVHGSVMEDCLGVKRLGTHPQDGFEDVTGTCDAPLSQDGKSDIDTSTYDVQKHAFGLNMYAEAIHAAFKMRSKLTFEELSMNVVAARIDFMSLVLTRIIEQQELVLDSRHRSCTIRQQGKLYVAEPISNGAFDAGVRPRRHLVMQAASASDAPDLGPTGSAGSDQDVSSTFAASALSTVRDLTTTMTQELGIPQSTQGKKLLQILSRCILDAVLDRLSWAMLQSVIQMTLRGGYGKVVKAVGGKRGQLILDSLQASGVLVIGTDDDAYMRARNGKWYCASMKKGTGVNPDCDAAARVDPTVVMRMASNMTTRSAAPAALVQNQKGLFEFRLLASDTRTKAASKGTICSQTSASTLDQLKAKCLDALASVGPSFEPTILDGLPKKRVCLLYELILRLSGSLARPAQMHD